MTYVSYFTEVEDFKHFVHKFSPTVFFLSAYSYLRIFGKFINDKHSKIITSMSTRDALS